MELPADDLEVPAATPSADEPARLESRWDALNAGRDAACSHGGQQITLSRWTRFDSSVQTDEGERRCYLLSEPNHLSRFLPAALTRESSSCKLLPSWAWLRLLPPDFYRIVFELSATPGCFRAVPDSKLLVDGYPSGSRSPTDPERVAGFATQKDLRVVLYPNALRFFWAGLHEPLRADGAWPTARQVMQSGYVLRCEVRNALADRLAAAIPDTDWSARFRQEIRLRHWPAKQIVPTQGDHGVPRPLNRPHEAIADAIDELNLHGKPDAELAEWPEPGWNGAVLPPHELCHLAQSATIFRLRTLRSYPPDMVCCWASESCEGSAWASACSVWAFDLDSVTIPSARMPGGYGFSRILQIIPRKSVELSSQNSRELQDNVTRVAPRPQWGSALMTACGKLEPWHWGCQSSLMLAEWTESRRDFWSRHECRVWQFTELRGGLPHNDLTADVVLSEEDLEEFERGRGGRDEEVDPDKYWVLNMAHIHSFLVSGSGPNEWRWEIDLGKQMTFSPSLCESGEELFGSAPDEGFAVLSPALAKLMPFYLHYRREMGQANKTLAKLRRKKQQKQQP